MATPSRIPVLVAIITTSFLLAARPSQAFRHSSSLLRRSRQCRWAADAAKDASSFASTARLSHYSSSDCQHHHHPQQQQQRRRRCLGRLRMVSTATPSSFSMPEKRPPKKTSSGSSDEAAVQSAVQNSLSAETDRGLGSSPVKRTVMKFGGSSLADADRIRFVADIVASQRRTVGVDPMVVCSAMGSSTNQLLAAGDFALDGKLYTDAIRKLHIATCDDLGVDDNTRADVEALLSELEKLLNGILYLGELSPRSRDLLVSYGERMSVRLVAAQLNNLGVPSKAFDSWELGLRTTSNFGGAEVLPSSYDYIRETMAAEMKAHRNGSGGGGREEMEGELVAVVTGFIAHDERGRVTTLGRGGSDLTAAVLGAACGLDEIQVWKDVDGMLTADPRVVQTAVPVPSVTFVEASELAYFGAKILHPISMQPAAAYNIPVRIKNSYNPDHPGTVIKDVVTDRGDDHLVTAITTKSDQTLIDITSTRMLGQHGFLAQVFRLFEQYKLSVDVVATSEISISLTLSSSAGEAAVRGVVDEMTRPTSATSLSALRPSLGPSPAEGDAMAEVLVKEGRSIISLIANVDRSSDVMAGVFSVLAAEKVHVEMMSQGASKVNISLIVSNEDLKRALQALHDFFFSERVAAAGPFVAPPEK